MAGHSNSPATLSSAVLSLIHPNLEDEILKPIASSCLRDNECQSTCCHSEECSTTDQCEGSRQLIITIFTVVCLMILVGGIVAYCVCLKNRRKKRYDERLNSIHSMSHGQNNA